MGRAPEGFCDGHAVEMNNVSLQYDAFGRRIKNLAGTSFLYNGANAAQELSGSTVTANLMSGGVDEVLTRTDSSGSFKPLKDALGSTIALVDPSSNVQTSYTYDPFGGTSVTGSSNSNEFQYTGRENEGNGLYFYRARYYSPLLGRFISQDPLGLSGGINEYIYALDSPLNWIDPSGLRVTVYFWPNQGFPGTSNFRWGHVVMAVDGVAGQSYISWQPAITPDSLGRAPAALTQMDNNTMGLQRDIDIEGGQPLQVEIDGLDEKAILAWWNHYKADDPQFRMFGRNCSNTITKALQAGGAQMPLPASPRTVFEEAREIRDIGLDWATWVYLSSTFVGPIMGPRVR